MSQAASRISSVEGADAVAVTGIGLRSPIGHTPDELLASIRACRSGLAEITSFDVSALQFKHAGEIRSALFDAEAAATFEGVDRTGVLAMLAARSAVEDAGLDLGALSPLRVALVVGVCAGGAGKTTAIEAFSRNDQGWPEALLSTSHYAQTQAVARWLGIHGPCVTISTACASSASALGYAWELVDQGTVDVAIAGGADAFSFFTYAGFHALGAMATAPCSPFSKGTGVTFGEGAAFVVLERSSRARARSARTHGLMLGYGASADCYHMTAPDPSGAGLERAMRDGLSRAGIDRSSVDYINAHGTGTHDNDLAESSAIKMLFAGCDATPPVSSSKSFFGHTMGGAGALEFVVSLLCQNEGIVPPTLNFDEARPGCTLDYVPNRARSAEVRCFLSNSAAFGGVNVALVGARTDVVALAARRAPADEIVLSGMGLVSPLGHDLAVIKAALARGESGLRLGAGATPVLEGRAQDFDLRKVLRAVDARRLDRINQLVLGAAALALADGRGQSKLDPLRVGTVIGHTRGPAATELRFLEAMRDEGLERLSPKYFPAVVLSTICGQVCEKLELRGLTSTLVDGVGAGLHALVHAFHTLKNQPALDALLVMAGDEIGTLYQDAYRSLGRMARDGRRPALYAPQGAGGAPGEGAAALLIERRSSAERRGAKIYGVLRSCRSGSDATMRAPDPEGRWLAETMAAALDDAGLSSATLDLVYGHGRGVPSEDGRELAALRRVLGSEPVPVGCITGHTGTLEAASALQSVAVAALSMEDGLAYPIVSDAVLPSSLAFVQGAARPGSYGNVLITASTEYGNHAAVVLEKFMAGAPS